MARIIEYKAYSSNWVEIVSITPMNKVTIRYEGLNLVLDNEIYYVVLYIDSSLKLESDEISDYDFRNDIRIKYNND